MKGKKYTIQNQWNRIWPRIYTNLENRTGLRQSDCQPYTGEIRKAYTEYRSEESNDRGLYSLMVVSQFKFPNLSVGVYNALLALPHFSSHRQLSHGYPDFFLWVLRALIPWLSRSKTSTSESASSFFLNMSRSLFVSVQPITQV